MIWSWSLIVWWRLWKKLLLAILAKIKHHKQGILLATQLKNHIWSWARVKIGQTGKMSNIIMKIDIVGSTGLKLWLTCDGYINCTVTVCSLNVCLFIEHLSFLYTDGCTLIKPVCWVVNSWNVHLPTPCTLTCTCHWRTQDGLDLHISTLTFTSRPIWDLLFSTKVSPDWTKKTPVCEINILLSVNASASFAIYFAKWSTNSFELCRAWQCLVVKFTIVQPCCLNSHCSVLSFHRKQMQPPIPSRTW